MIVLRDIPYVGNGICRQWYSSRMSRKKLWQSHLDDKFEMACQLARAVSCLHNEGTIIHRDLVIHLYYNTCIIQLLFVV
jgi:serine/threonine protein kinase